MVMKVGNINQVLFRANNPAEKLESVEQNKTQITELSSVTPDFAVKIPQKYYSLGVQKASNGLDIYSYKLANGHKVTIIPMKDSATVVKNYVNVGSMNETDDIKGISHFLEHMAFNGTNGTEGYLKLNQGDSFKKIDELGGWTNASTNYAITDYVNSTQLLNKADLETQLKVIASMTEDLALTKSMIQKEKGPVSSEINMILDNPQTIALDQTVRTLFNIKSSADELVGGSVNHIQNLTQEKVKEYYDTYYTPDNMNLVITGNVNPDETIKLISKLFKSNKKLSGKTYEEKLNPINKTLRKDFISDKASSCDIILGFAGYQPKNTKESIAFQIAENYLAMNSIGIQKGLRDLNASGGFGIEKITTNPHNPSFIYFSTRSSEKNSEKVLKLLFDKLSDIKAPTEYELQKIKDKLVSERENTLEYSSFVNDLAGRSMLNGSLDNLTEYNKILEEITPNDIENFIKKYINTNKTAITVVHPKTTTKEINANYKEASKLSFKGSRKPVNTEIVSTTKLSNNYNTASLKTKSSNINYNLNLYYDMPENINPATISVLNRLYKMGAEGISRDEFDKICEDNNVFVSLNLSSEALSLSGNGTYKNKKELFKLGKTLIQNPNFTEDALEKAKLKIKDNLARKEDDALDLFIDNEARINKLYSSTSDIEENLDKVTLDDVIKLHKYILSNSSGTISYNIPESNPEFKQWAENEFESLPQIKPEAPKKANVYKVNNEIQVLTKAKNVSQAEIIQTYKFEKSDNIKDKVVAQIMNSLLSSSSSIGLFNTLREQEHLAYTVYSDIDSVGNCGELSLNILTTTDNKEIGEISYENVQKSINGFNRQIKCLLNSEYSQDDFESAKKLLKSNLLSNEGTPAKLNSLDNGLFNNGEIDYENKIFDIIDSITREDIDNFSKKLFSTAPIYSIVASQDTLDANKDYLENLKV